MNILVWDKMTGKSKRVMEQASFWRNRVYEDPGRSVKILYPLTDVILHLNDLPLKCDVMRNLLKLLCVTCWNCIIMHKTRVFFELGLFRSRVAIIAFNILTSLFEIFYYLLFFLSKMKRLLFPVFFLKHRVKIKLRCILHCIFKTLELRLCFWTLFNSFCKDSQ